MTFKHSIHIDAPVEKVFAFLSDPANWKDIGRTGVVITEVHLNDHGVGTSYSWEARILGLPIRGTNTFTEFAPNERITDESTLALEGTWRYSFEPEGAGMRLTFENLPSSFMRLPLLNKLDELMASGHKKVMYDLKERMES